MKKHLVLQSFIVAAAIFFTFSYFTLSEDFFSKNESQRYADFSNYKKKPKNEKAPKINYSDEEQAAHKRKLDRYQKKLEDQAANPSVGNRTQLGNSSYANGKIKGNWIQQEVNSTSSANYIGKGFRTLKSAYDKARDKIYVTSSAGHLWRVDRDENNVANTSWTVLNNKENFGWGSLHVMNTNNGSSVFVRSYSQKMQYSNNEGKTWRDARGINFNNAWDNSALQDMNSGQRLVALVETKPSNKIEAVATVDGVNYTSLGEVKTARSNIIEVSNSDNLYLLSFEANSIKTERLRPNSRSFEVVNTANINIPVSGYSKVFGTYSGGRYHFYYVTGNDIYYSNNEGASWRQTRSAGYGSSGDQLPKSVDANNPSNLFRGYLDLYISNDYGKTFRETYHKLGWDIRHMKNYTKRDGKVFHLVGNDFGLFMSYTPSNQDTYINLNNGAGNAMMYDADASGRNYSSAAMQDIGSQEFSQNEETGFTQIQSTDGLRVVYANDGKSCWTWMYYGAMFHRKSNAVGGSSTSNPRYFWDNWQGGVLVESPNPNENAIYMAAFNQLQKFSLSGNDIIQEALPYNFGSVTTGFGYSLVDRNRWYASTSNGDFYYSTNSGNSFTKSNNVPNKPKANDIGSYTRAQHTIKTSATNPLRVYYVGSGNTMLISNDGGKSFKEHKNGLDVYRFRDIAVTDDDKFVFAACGTSGMWVYSRDDDKWYEMFDGPIPYVDVTSVEYVKETNMVQFSTYGYGIMQLMLENTVTIPDNSNTNSTEACDFKQLNGLARDVGTGGGKTYVIGTNGQVFLRENNNWTSLPYAFDGVKIDVTGAGVPYAVASNQRIYYFTNGRWRRTRGRALDIGCSGNTIYIIGRDNKIYKKVNDDYQVLPSGKGKRIDVAGSGRPWVTGISDNRVYEYKNNKWNLVGNLSAQDISIAEGGSEVWALSYNDGAVYSYKGNNNWQKNDGIGTNISVASDKSVWVVNKNNNIFVANCSSTNSGGNTNDRLRVNGDYTIKSSVINQNVTAPSWDNYNARMYDAGVIYPDHQWEFKHIGGDKHTIKNKGTGRYLSVSEAACNNSTNAITWTNANASHMQWYIERSGSNYYLLPVHCPTQALSKNTSAPNVTTWQYNKSYGNQQFDIISVNGSTRPRSSSLIDLQASTTLDRKADLEWHYYLDEEINEVLSYTLQYFDNETQTYVDIQTMTAEVFSKPNNVQATFVHDTPIEGENLYRVKIEMATGDFAFSHTEFLVLESVDLPITIAPNPATEVLRLNLSKYRDQSLDYTIVNAFGKEIISSRINKDHGDLEVISLERFKNGNYFIRIKPENNRAMSLKFMVMRNY